MNQQELQQLKTHLQQLADCKTSEWLASQFPDTDLSARQLYNYTVSEWEGLVKRIVSIFQSHLDGPFIRHWPIQIHFYSQTLGNTTINVAQALNQIAAHIQSRNWDHAAYYTEAVIAYLIQMGAWGPTPRPWHVVDRARHHALFSDLELKEQQLRALIAEIQSLKAEQANLATQRAQETAQINSQLSQAQAHAGEISTLFTQATSHQATIDQILGQQKTNHAAFVQELAEIAKGKQELTEKLNQAADKLTQSEGRLSFMQEKADWVNGLAGTAAAGVLGKKFEARMRQLSQASKLWARATAGSVVAAAIWLYVSHTYLMIKGETVWTTFALNFGLLLPAIFIVGFFAKQFGKVRHFEEEYAFRSAVAMTVSAFADRLADSPQERNKLIAETVEKLYRLPVLLQEREPHGWFSQRSTERMVKATTELVSAVKKP
jgi:hypothetical protein